MTPAFATEAAQRRRANFFRDTRRDTDRQPEADTSTEHLETVALASVKTNLEAHAQSLGRTLTGAALDTMLQAAQSYLRRLPRDQLQGFNSSSALMSSIIKDSYAAAPVADARAAAALAAGQGHTGGADPSNVIAGRFRDGLERETLASSQRYAAMAGEGFSQADTAKIAAAMAVARDYGMTWMNPRDLLSIGAAGVKAIAEVNLKQDSYQRLRTDGRFEAKDVVTLADYAKAKGIKDANHLANTTVAVVQLGKDEAEQLRISQANVAYMDAAAAAIKKPHDPVAQQRASEAANARKAVLAPIAARGQHERDTIAANELAMKMDAKDRVVTVKAETAAVIKTTAVVARNAADDDMMTAPKPKPVDKPVAAQTTLPPATPAAKLPAPK